MVPPNGIVSGRIAIWHSLFSVGFIEVPHMKTQAYGGTVRSIEFDYKYLLINGTTLMCKQLAGVNTLCILGTLYML